MPWYHGIPWYTVVLHGIPWYTMARPLRACALWFGHGKQWPPPRRLWYAMVYHGTHFCICMPWYTMVYRGIPWYTMVYHGMPWYTMVYHGMPWYTMVYRGIPWHTMVCHGMPWYTMVHHGKGGHACMHACVHACMHACLLYTSPSPRDRQKSRMPSSA